MAYTIGKLREIVELAKRKKYDELEERWLEMTEAPTNEMRFYDATIRALLKNEARPHLAELLNVMAGALTSQGRAAEALEIVRLAWRQAPDMAELRDAAAGALRALHGDRPNFQHFHRTAGLDERAGLDQALRRFERMLSCDVGEVFEHKSLGIGVVEAIEPERQRVTIRFPGKPPREFTFEGVEQFLVKHERGGFRAERLRNPDDLKRMALANGPDFVRHVLKDFPEGLSQLDLKAMLLEGVLTREEWDRWWAANRKLIRRDPYIDSGRGPRSPLRVRTAPKTYYEGVAEEFADADTGTRQALIAEARKHIEEEAPPADFASRLLESLRAEIGALEAEDFAGRLERYFLARDLEQAFGAQAPADYDPKTLLKQAADAGAVIRSLSTADMQIRAQETLAAADAERARTSAAKMAPAATPRFAQWLIDWLIAQGQTDAAAIAVEQILGAPRRNPEVFLSVTRQYIEGEYAALAVEIEPHTIVREMAEYMKENQNEIDHGVPHAPTLRGIQMRMRNLLADNHFELLKQAVAPLTVADARNLLKVFESHSAFPDTFLPSLRQTIVAFRPELEGQSEAERAADIDPTVLYVTPDSLRKRRADLQHIRSVEIPKNSREIGEAAAMGDLSENAEYEAARHRQRMLFTRAEEIQNELEHVRLISPNWVRTDQVWIGTRLIVRDVATGQVEHYAILGAWDSRPEEGVYSYLTPAAAAFLRKRVGERVTVQRDNQPVEYEIVGIEKAALEEVKGEK